MTPRSEWATYTGRASGRTNKQINDLHNGAIFFVSTPQMVMHARQCLERAGRKTSDLQIRVLVDPDQLRGLRKSVFDIDHGWHDHISNTVYDKQWRGVIGSLQE